MSDEVTIFVHLEIEVEMSVGEVWPEGDAPELPTAKDVVIAMKDTGTRRQVIDGWELLTYSPEIDLSVTVQHRLQDGVRRSTRETW